MSTPLEGAREQVARLEHQDSLEQALYDAGDAYEANPTEENLRAHDQAAVALAEHRASGRGQGVSVGGDAVVMDPNQGDDQGAYDTAPAVEGGE